MTKEIKVEVGGAGGVQQAYNDHLSGISHFQGQTEEIGKRTGTFIETVSTDPRISKEDLAKFIANNAFMWDLHRRVVRSLPSDD